MVSDRELSVHQVRDSKNQYMIIQSQYLDDPAFTLDQEKALHEIARAMLIANRKREAEKRKREKARERKRDEKVKEV